ARRGRGEVARASVSPTEKICLQLVTPRNPIRRLLACKQFDARNIANKLFDTGAEFVGLTRVLTDRCVQDLFDTLALSLVTLAADCQPTLFGAGTCVITQPQPRFNAKWKQTLAPGWRHLDPDECDGAVLEIPNA